MPAPSDLQAAGAAEDAETADEWEEDAEDQAADDQGSTLPSSAENADEQAGPSPRTLQQVSYCPAFAGSPSELHSPLMCWGRHRVPCLSCLRLPAQKQQCPCQTERLELPLRKCAVIASDGARLISSEAVTGLVSLVICRRALRNLSAPPALPFCMSTLPCASAAAGNQAACRKPQRAVRRGAASAHRHGSRQAPRQSGCSGRPSGSSRVTQPSQPGGTRGQQG